MDNSKETKIDKYTKLFEILITQNRTYHDHKETMAHAALALQLAIITWIVSQDIWPPVWINNECISANTLSIVGFMIIWTITHVFIRWQLRNRRSSAIIQTAYINIIRKWINKLPTDVELLSYNSNNNKKNKIYLFIDYILPCPYAALHYDLNKKEYPKCFVKEWEEQESKYTGAIRSEWLLWLASVLMFIIGIMRII